MSPLTDAERDRAAGWVPTLTQYAKAITRKYPFMADEADEAVSVAAIELARRDWITKPLAFTALWNRVLKLRLAERSHRDRLERLADRMPRPRRDLDPDAPTPALDALARLPGRQGDALALCVVAEMTVGEAAETLGMVSYASTDRLRERGLRSLRLVLLRQ